MATSERPCGVRVCVLVCVCCNCELFVVIATLLSLCANTCVGPLPQQPRHPSSTVESNVHRTTNTREKQCSAVNCACWENEGLNF